MLEGFAGPISTEFRYCTVKDIRDEGYGTDVISDDRIRQLIVLCSNWINWLTKQWFLPVRLRQKTDGRHSAVVNMPTFVPIIELYNLLIEKENMFSVVLPSIAYEVRPRYVQMLSYKVALPDAPQFMVLDGVFGWMENSFHATRTTVTDPVAVGDMEITLASVTGINVGDAMLVGRDPIPSSGAFIVTEVDGTGLTVTADAPVMFSCPVGMPAVKYGKVPGLIRWATILLVRDKAVPLGSVGTDIDEMGPKFWRDRFLGESVEGYSYNMAGIPTMYGAGGGTWTTGNPEVDDILQQFNAGSQVVYIGSTY